MTQQYFAPQPTVESNPRPATWQHGERIYTFQTDTGVFSRGEIDYGSYLLVESLPALQGRVLDLGCGYGFLGVAAALCYPGIEVTMTDINQRAVTLARQNAAAHGVNCTVLQADGLAAVQGKFDFVLTNPPIHAGKALYYGWFAAAREYLQPGGSLILVMHKKHGAASVQKDLLQWYDTVTLRKRSAGYHILQATRI